MQHSAWHALIKEQLPEGYFSKINHFLDEALASAYETNRVTFLYDIERHYDQIIIVYEVMTDAFRATLQNKLQPFSKQTLIFVKQ